MPVDVDVEVDEVVGGMGVVDPLRFLERLDVDVDVDFDVDVDVDAEAEEVEVVGSWTEIWTRRCWMKDWRCWRSP